VIIRRHVLLLLVLIMLGGLAYSMLSHTGHDFTDQQCGDCHAMTPIKGKRETLRMTAPVRYLCSRCHSSHIENSLSHPVEMVPVSAIPPADLPLSWDGYMTCSTCHDIHAASHDTLLTGRGSLRRNVSGAELCSACHTASAGAAGSKGSTKHTAMMPLAHVNSKNMKFVPDTDLRGGKIDKISKMCLGCHDGSVGSDVNAPVRSGSWKHGGSFSSQDPQGSHPIGMKYRGAAKRGGLRPMGMLDRAIKLVDGRVGCPSCHDPYSKERAFLVMSNNGSRLCLQCHDK
jgi:predicted CXXCH cytochrome family protein